MPPFFGVTKTIHDLNIPETSVTPVYEGFHGYVYSNLVEHNTADVDIVGEWVGPSPSRVLDLCCGSGRFVRRLAADGHTVTGVDISKDMLTQARRQWSSSDSETLLKATFTCADATTLDLGEAFDTVLVGGLSLSIMRGHEGRVSLLRGARRHLEPGGSLIFDYMPFPDMDTPEESYHAFPFPGEDGQAFMVLSVLQDPTDGVQVTNMYSELIDAGGRTQRLLSAEMISYVSEEEMGEELTQAGFRVAEQIDTTPASPTGKKLPRTLMLRCEAI